VQAACCETIVGTSERGPKAVAVFSDGIDGADGEGIRGAGHSLVRDTEESEESGGGSGGDCEGGV